LISKPSLRNLLFDYVLSRPSLNPTATQSWRTIPYLDRERVQNLAR